VAVVGEILIFLQKNDNFYKKMTKIIFFVLFSKKKSIFIMLTQPGLGIFNEMLNHNYKESL